MKPPWLVEWLLRRTVPAESADSIVGDLVEEMQGARSRLLFVRHACSISVRYAPGLFRRALNERRERKPLRMESLLLDVKFAARSLAKRPSLAVIVLATLALGIGAATAIFSVVHAVLLQPLPYRDPDRVVFANELNGGDRMAFAWPNYVDIRDRANSFDSIACHQGNDFNVIGDGRPRRIRGRLVCAPFFDVLGVAMQAGRGFTKDDDSAGAHPVMVVGDRFWRLQIPAGSTAATTSG